MKSIKNFKINELKGMKLTSIYGGKDKATSMSTDAGTLCDIHHDTNDNGTIDEGECIDFVECK